MTTRPLPAQRRKLSVIPLLIRSDAATNDFEVTGRRADLHAVIALHASLGTLIHATAPTGTATDAVTRLRLRNDITITGAPVPSDLRIGVRWQPPPAWMTTEPRPQRCYVRAATIALTIAGITAGLLTAAAYLLGELVAFLTDHAAAIAGALVLAAIGLVVVAKIIGSRKRHCPCC